VKESILAKAKESAELTVRFFEAHAVELERCAFALAERFRAGGRLFVMGNGGSACDAQHAAVEFAHPIVEKRRSLAASSLAIDAALITAIGNDRDFAEIFADQIERSARREDAALAISTSGASANVNHGLRRAREKGLLTIAFAGRDGGSMIDLAEICFVVPSWSIHRVQEVHGVLLHLLWDQVHVALGEDDVL
jgi:D-sedoheptulose 7-phosphate isomerase